MPGKKITAIVLNWNEYKKTKMAIASLLKSNRENFSLNVVIVDNGSHDGSTQKLEKEFIGVRFIYNGSNLGFAKGVNIGVRYAVEVNSDAVFLLNNDAIVGEDTLEKLASVLFSGDNRGIAGPCIFYLREKDRVWQGGGYFSKLKMGVVVPEKNKIRGDLTNTVKIVDFLSGCAMLVKKEVFDSIGFFDERFFFYGEDLDFCLRAKKAGFDVLYVTEASAWHDIDINKNRTTPFVLYNLARTSLLLVKKNFAFAGLVYSVLLFIFFLTPFRLFQIIRGGNNIKNILSWIRGGFSGLFIKL